MRPRKGLLGLTRVYLGPPPVEYILFPKEASTPGLAKNSNRNPKGLSRFVAAFVRWLVSHQPSKDSSYQLTRCRGTDVQSLGLPL